MDRGYTLQWRKSWDNPVLKEPGKVFSKYEAWLYIVNVLANGIERNGMQRGEFEASYRYMARAWNWTVNKTYRFINTLIDENMLHRIEHQIEHQIEHFIVCEYETYNPTQNTKQNTKQNKSKEGIKEVKIKDTCQCLFDIYQQENNRLPGVKAFTDERKRKCQSRINRAERDGRLEQFLPDFREAVRKAQLTPFLRGEGSTGWKASFDWFIANDTNIYKVLEGKYDSANPKEPQYPTLRTEDFR